jgi:hypothetical protein
MFIESMAMETEKSAEQRRLIDERLSMIKAYVDGFELFLPKDEAALGEIADMLKRAAERVGEMDESRIKRKRLVGELDKAFTELENSQKQFVEKVRSDAP